MSDRISNLPDSVLLHILSSNSLETKDVVATSLLSKRWRSLWHSIPKLEFHDNFHSYQSFLQFIDATLNSVDLESLKMFSLQCEDFDAYPIRCDVWVNKVLKSKLEYLHLCFAPCYNSLVGLPLPSIFRSNTIRILKLFRVNISNLYTVHLPSLKTLHLMNVEFSNAESLGMLLCTCVRLQKLLLMYVEFHDYVTTKLDIGRLHRLVIAEVTADLVPLEAFSNVTFLSLEEHDFIPDDYDIPTFSNLTHLEIRLHQNELSSMVSCLRSFPKLETLIIRESLDEVLDCWMGPNPDWSMEPNPDDDDGPPCVSSNLKTFALGGFEYLHIEFETVRFIMKYAKALKSVIIWTVDADHRWQKAKRLKLLGILSSYPKCSQNCRLFIDDPADDSLFQSVNSRLVSDKDFSYYFED